GEMSSSLRSSRASRATNRSDLRGTSFIDSQQPAMGVDGERFPDERRRARSCELPLEALGPGFELGGRRAPGPQRGVDLGGGGGRNGRELAGAQEVLGER